MKTRNNIFTGEFEEKILSRFKAVYYKIDEKFRKTFNCVSSFISKQTSTLLIIALVLLVPYLASLVFWHISVSQYTKVEASVEELAVAQKKLDIEIGQLNKKLLSKRPFSYFLVINSSSNEFELYKGDRVIKQDKCSTGSYILLKNGDDQQWMFNTPKGEFRIQGKTTSPVWRKPDWAFIEEGLPVPASNHHSRFESGVLGDYALSLGDGYLIHGTLYQRFLGLPVSHGCIRLNDESLELIYQSMQIGSKVYIF